MSGIRDRFRTGIQRLTGPAPREAAVCYRFDDKLLLCASCVTEAGFGLDSEPYRVLAADASDAELGAALLAVLAGSKRILPTPDGEQVRAARGRLLRAAGLSSERKLQQKAMCSTISREGPELRFTPSHNGGTRGDAKGFHHRDAASVTIAANAPPARAAQALREALSRCTSVHAATAA